MAQVTDFVSSNLVRPFLGELQDYPKCQRAARVVSAPIYCATAMLDVALGAVALFGTAVTLGKFKTLSQFAWTGLKESKEIAHVPYRILLAAVNPNWQSEQRDVVIQRKGNGFASNWVASSDLKNIAEKQASSKVWTTRHVTSRLTYGVLAVACLVTRAVDAVIALPAAALSLLTCGKFSSLNNLAYRTTQAPAVIHGFFACITKVINPRANVSLNIT